VITKMVIGCVGLWVGLNGCVPATFTISNGKVYSETMDISTEIPKTGWLNFTPRGYIKAFATANMEFRKVIIQIEQCPHDHKLGHIKKNLSKDMPLEQVAKLIKENLRYVPGFNNLETLSSNAAQINGLTGHQHTFTYTNNEGLLLKQTTYILREKDSFYFLSYFDSKKGRFAQSFMETFISVSLSQFPESLIESELFGHRKGAFTGAVDTHVGLFELCGPHSSLFLDEIGDLTVSVQTKLLQVLQERIFSPVGSHSLKHFNGRVIAATNRSIEKLRKEGRFRDDLFYRLCSDVIIVPTLCQRISESPSELEQLVKSLLKRITGEESEKLNGMILETLHRDLPPAYPWPGNVRELEQALRRILLNRHYKGDLMVMKPDLEDDFIQKIQMGNIEAKELLSEYCNFLYQRFQNYEEVARRTQLDRRTVKKYITNTGRGF